MKVELIGLVLAAFLAIAARAEARVQTFDQPAGGAWSPRNAIYEIEARVDPAARSLKGRETIRWRNISNRATSEIRIHLYWNAWRNDESTWMRERRREGSVARLGSGRGGRIDVSAVRLRRDGDSTLDITPSIRFLAPDDGNTDDRTLMVVTLPEAVKPTQGIDLDIAWTATIPTPFRRTGAIGDYIFAGQWFPKIGVLEDGGWRAHQFHAGAEFYADYGSYTVRVTLPAGFLVGATGREMEVRTNTDGTATHWYRADDVHDFAWAASPSFIDLRRRFTHEALPAVDIRLLLRPEHRAQADRYFAAATTALQRYGEWFGPYPYPTLTIVDPAFQSLSDGMEYPTLVTGRTRWIAPRTVAVPESTAIHEIGHQWWYGMVATNEVEHGWMDEGINTYVAARVIDETFRPNVTERRLAGGFLPWTVPALPWRRELDGDRMAGYRAAPSTPAASTPTWRQTPETATALTYDKTALWMHTLERHLGWPTMQRALRLYFDRWRFRHPEPDDFFSAVNEASGQDLSWFFDQVHRSTATFDYSVEALASAPADGPTNARVRSTVTVRRLGEGHFPVEVVTRFRDGTSTTERWDGAARRLEYVYERPVEAVSAEVDPGHVLLLDVNRTNNSRTREPRAGEASLIWTLRWMAWLQEVLAAYAFFA